MIGHITIINIAIGSGWALASAVMAYAIMMGKYIYEPNLTIAITEFVITVLALCWFLWQIPYWWIKLRRRKNNAT